MIRNSSLAIGCLALAGCEQVVGALERLDGLFKDEPAFYVAQAVQNEANDNYRYRIIKLPVLEGREGAPDTVRFETLPRTIGSVGAQGEGLFTALSLRQDGAVIAAVAQERLLGGEPEFYAKLIDTQSEKSLMSGTDDILVSQYQAECTITGDPALPIEIADDFGYTGDDLQVYWTLSPDVATSRISFIGWSQNGNAVFSLTLTLNLTVEGLAEDGTSDFLEIREFLTSETQVTYSAATGNLQSCEGEPLQPVELSTPPYRVVPSKISETATAFDIVPRNDAGAPLFRFPTPSSGPVQFFLLGDLRLAGPSSF
jgi:hypothetical protein